MKEIILIFWHYATPAIRDAEPHVTIFPRDPDVDDAANRAVLTGIRKQVGDHLDAARWVKLKERRVKRGFQRQPLLPAQEHRFDKMNRLAKQWFNLAFAAIEREMVGF